MVEISTSILSVEKEKIIDTIYDLENAKTDYFHVDVMDGEFVKNDTHDLMLEYGEYLNHVTKMPLDIHLMVKDIKNFVDSYKIFGPNLITFHYEACKDKVEVKENINYIKEKARRVGIAIKPETPVSEIYEFLPFVHVVLVMTVEPGEGGQKLIPETINKIEELNKYRNEKVILPSGREVTRAEKDKIEKNYLKDTAIRKLTQESKNISEEITKKDKELKENIDKKMNFRYEFEKDAEGKSTGKVLNEKELDGIIATIHNLKKDMTELNGMQAECQKYLEEFKQKDQEKMDEVAKAWNNVKPEEKEVETKQVSEPQTNSQSQTSSEQPREGNSQPNNNDINGLEENILRQTQLEEQEGKNENSQNEQPEVDTEKNGSEQPETGRDENVEKETEKPGIVIARKVTITNKQNFFGVGKIGKIFKKDNEDKTANLKKIFAKGKEETLNDIAEKVDPAIIEGVIELRKRNMLTEKQAQKAIFNLATGSATKENLDFTIEYNMKDLSKWAFLPWNRGVRDQVAKVAEENRKNEIAEFTDGVEYEPNPIKRMMARVKQKKLGNGKEKEDNVEEKTSKASNVFKKRIKDEAQKSDYEQLRDDIIAGKDVESLDEIIKKAKEATRTGKISTTELQNLMNNAETMKKDIASRENEEPEEKKVIINDPQEMEK